MKKKILSITLFGVGLILSIIFISCSNEKGGTALENENLKRKLIGKWGGLGEEVPVFYFTADSIYYYDRLKSYSYKILNDDVIIYFPGYKGMLKRVTIVKDTMFFFDDLPDTIRAYRHD